MSDNFLLAAAATLLPNIGGCFSKIPIRKNMGWYINLKKPQFTPPNCVFTPTWRVLYSAMGYSSYLVFKHGSGCAGPARIALMVYGGHLLLNWSWMTTFFSKRKLKLSLCHLVAIDVTGILTAYLFYQIKPLAGWLFLPYFAWLGYTTILMCSIVKNNPVKDIQGATITEIKDE